MNRHLWITASLLIGIVATRPGGAQTVGYRPVAGQPHPEFVLPRIDTRQPVWLSQFRGKKVLLVHFASW